MDEDIDIRIAVPIQKGSVDEDRRLVGGVAYFAKKGGIDLRDTQGDTIDVESLRDAVHKFMRGERTLGVMHMKADGQVIKSGEVVEAAVLGDAFSPPGWPSGDVAFWIVAKVASDEVWQAIKSGEFTGFSIGGSGVRIPE